MKVLVTGVTGFIGFHVARLLLEKGFDVCALARKERRIRHEFA
jgi:nucleoside-diphosphate-sugar epimerase